MTPDPDARRRALQVLASTVGPGAATFQPIDLTQLAPAMPPAEVEGVARTGLAEEAALRQRAEEGAALADLGQSTSRAVETLTGAPGAGLAAGQRQRAAEPLKDFLRLQEAKARAPAASATTAKPAKSTDPNSPASRRAQALVKSTLGDVYADDEVAQMSEADADLALKYGSMRGQREVSREGQVAANKRDTANRDQRAQQFAQRMGLDWAKMGQDERLAIMRLQESQLKREQDATQTQQKTQRTLAERNVGGFTFDPNNPPSAEASKKMADTAIARDEILSSLDNLERMYQESGSEQLGERAGEMESEWINITNRLRTLNEMGVPNGADYEMLAKQIADPTEWRAITTGKARGLAKMRTTRDQVQRRVAATAKALKFVPEGQRPTSSAPTRVPAATALPKDASGQPTLVEPSTGDMVRVILNGAPKRVPRANLEKVRALAKDKGYTLEVPGG